MDKIPTSFEAPLNTNENILKKFVGRKSSLERFQAMLAGNYPARVMVIDGLPNSGKTWLLVRLQSEAIQRQIPTSLIDFSFGQVYDEVRIVHHIANELGSQFFVKLNRELQEAVQFDVGIELKTTSRKNRIEISGNVEAGGDVDVAGGDIIRNNTFNLNIQDTSLRKIWNARISEAFIEDLEHFDSAQHVVLIYDAFEKATIEAQTWIMNTLIRRVGKGELSRVTILLASNESMVFPPGWDNLLVREALAPFDLEQVREYLIDRCKLAINDATLERIYQITHGQVDQIGLIAEYQPRLTHELETEQIYEVLVEGILRSHPRDTAVTELLSTAALTDWFDSQLLADMLDDHERIDERLNDIRQFSFVTQDASGVLRISSEAVRNELLKTWDGKQQRYLLLRRRAAEHFQERAKTVFDQSFRENLEIQAISNLLEVDESQAMARLKVLFQNASTFHRLSTCQLLLQSTSKVIRLSGSSRLWLQYYEGNLAFERNEYKASKEKLATLLSKTEEGSELHALIAWCLGDVQAEQGFWADAIQYYDLSLKYYQAQKDLVKAGQIKMALCDIYIDQARAIGDPIQPVILRGRNWKQILRSFPSLIVAFIFILYDRLFQRWDLPPLHQGMNYRNWSLVNLLLIAARWCKEAEIDFVKSAREDLVSGANWKLAQIYYHLGWQQKASNLFQDVLNSGPVVNNPYWHAQVSQGYAEIELSLERNDEAIKSLKKSLQRFIQMKDIHAQAEVCALLGKAWMQSDKFESGLAFYRHSIRLFLSLGDYSSAGLAVQTLHECQQSLELEPKQLQAIENLINQTPDKVYLLRVPDKLATLLEVLITASLILFAFSAVILFSVMFIANLTNPGKFLASVFSPISILYFLGIGLLWLVILLIGAGILGLILILISIRQKPKPELLGQIETRTPYVSRKNHLGQEQRIPWSEMRAIQSQERLLWHRPFAILSGYRLIGNPKGNPIDVPATLAWYEDFKHDIDEHVKKNNLKLQRHKWDLRILSSWQGILFVLAPILGGLGSALVYNWIDIPMPTKTAVLFGPLLMLTSIIGLVAGPYWWMVLYPLWVRRQQKPETRSVWAITGLGIIIVSFAFYLDYFDPFFAIRQTLDRMLFPLGFILLILGPIWIISALKHDSNSNTTSTFVYTRAVRQTTALLLTLALVAIGVYIRDVWLVEVFYNFQAITFYYHGDYHETIARYDQALKINTNLVNAYYYQGRAYLGLGNYQMALEKFNRVVETGNAVAADYVSRAQAWQGIGENQQACQDLKTALHYKNGFLYISKEEQERIKSNYWEPWNCDLYLQP